MSTSVSLDLLNFGNYRTYLTALVMIACNLISPAMCHAFGLDGNVWLPIYFFTLVCAYKWGWRAGLLTALVSPVLNSLLFGLPAVAMAGIITIKLVLLAIVAAWVSRRCGSASVALLAAVVVFYQIFGTLADWAISGNFDLALSHIRTGIPGLLIQIFGGYAVLRALD